MNYCIFFISCHISKSVESIFKHFHILNEPYMNFFLQNNVTIVTTQDSCLIIRCLRVTIEVFSNVT